MSTSNDANEQADVKPCTIKALPKRLKLDSIRTAIAINPLNGIVANSEPIDETRPKPQRLTVSIGKRWDDKPRTLTVSFLEEAPLELKNRIISHMNAWNQSCCINFKLAESNAGQVRISFGPGGYWSYLGTDIIQIPSDEPTMNLEGFSLETSEAKFKRVVRHETGHTLGFEHEHMRREIVDRIDPQKAYAHFWETDRWDEPTVDEQVLTPLDEHSIMGTPPEVTSIMCYYLPAKIMRDKIGVAGGSDITPTDYAFAGKLYPLPVARALADRMSLVPSDPDIALWDSAKDVPYSANLIEQFNRATLQL